MEESNAPPPTLHSADHHDGREQRAAALQPFWCDGVQTHPGHHYPEKTRHKFAEEELEGRHRGEQIVRAHVPRKILKKFLCCEAKKEIKHNRGGSIIVFPLLSKNFQETCDQPSVDFKSMFAGDKNEVRVRFVFSEVGDGGVRCFRRQPDPRALPGLLANAERLRPAERRRFFSQASGGEAVGQQQQRRRRPRQQFGKQKNTALLPLTSYVPCHLITTEHYHMLKRGFLAFWESMIRDWGRTCRSRFPGFYREFLDQQDVRTAPQEWTSATSSVWVGVTTLRGD